MNRATHSLRELPRPRTAGPAESRLPSAPVGNTQHMVVPAFRVRVAEYHRVIYIPTGLADSIEPACRNSQNRMPLACIYWNVRPELLELGPLSVRWYGLFFALGFVLGYPLVSWMYRLEHKPPGDLDRLLGWVVAGTLIGARLGHCLFYEPAYYLSHPLEILAIWQGGLASHGAAVGILISLFLYTRTRLDQPFLWLLDRIVVVAALSGSFIRLGNLFNSEILGRPASVPWAFVFAREDLIPRHPVQLYESVGYAIVFFVLLLVFRRYRGETPRGALTGLFLLAVFGLRFVLEFFKERQADYGIHLPLSVGQYLSIPFVIVGAVLLWQSFRSHRRMHG